MSGTGRCRATGRPADLGAVVAIPHRIRSRSSTVGRTTNLSRSTGRAAWSRPPPFLG